MYTRLASNKRDTDKKMRSQIYESSFINMEAFCSWFMMVGHLRPSFCKKIFKNTREIAQRFFSETSHDNFKKNEYLLDSHVKSNVAKH